MLMTVYLDEVVPFSISNGHVTEVNLQVKSSVYGKVYFDILKDLSNYKEETDKANQGVTRAFDQDPELFSYDDIAEVDLYYKKKGSSERVDYHSFKVYTKRVRNTCILILFLHGRLVNMKLLAICCIVINALICCWLVI